MQMGARLRCTRAERFKSVMRKNLVISPLTARSAELRRGAESTGAERNIMRLCETEGSITDRHIKGWKSFGDAMENRWLGCAVEKIQKVQGRSTRLFWTLASR